MANTNQPNSGNRDDSSQRTGAGTPNQGQPARTGQDNAIKASASQRDEGSRVFGSATEPKAGQSRDGGNADTMRYLDAITENVGKLRAAISASSRDGASRSDERQGDQRRSSSEDNEAVREPNRDSKGAL